MQVLGVTGSSGSGKTTLIVAVLRELVAAGLTVSTIKHAHHGFDLDQPGKDSFRHREAGAAEVLVAGPDRWALLREEPAAPGDLSRLLSRMTPVDLVLVEGFRRDPTPKIEVYRPALGRAPYWPDDPTVLAVASDEAIPACGRPVLPLNEPAVIANWIRTHLVLAVGVTPSGRAGR